MLIKSVSFVKSAVKPAHYPPSEMPEIAFLGRSNVGKSSLINVLINRKNLVRTSSTPGRTQLINFFSVNDEFMLVDLPGYGFAKAPLEVRKQWGPMMESYLTIRENLRGVVLIFDIRRVPSPEDLQMIELIRKNSIMPIFVVTKCDKVSKNERKRQFKVISDTIGISMEFLLPFSALSREGINSIWESISNIFVSDSVDEQSV